jgi:metal-responsive CopG/Arc/MetJ family transcriptional regulator
MKKRIEKQIKMNENLLNMVDEHLEEINKNREKKLKRSKFIEKFIIKYLK